MGIGLSGNKNKEKNKELVYQLTRKTKTSGGHLNLSGVIFTSSGEFIWLVCVGRCANLQNIGMNSSSQSH